MLKCTSQPPHHIDSTVGRGRPSTLDPLILVTQRLSQSHQNSTFCPVELLRSCMRHAFFLRLALYWDTKTDGTSCVQVHFQKLSRPRQAQMNEWGQGRYGRLLITGSWQWSQVQAFFLAPFYLCRVSFHAADLFYMVPNH